MSVLPVTKNIRKIKIDFLFFALIRKIPLREKHAIREMGNKSCKKLQATVAPTNTVIGLVTHLSNFMQLRL